MAKRSKRDNRKLAKHIGMATAGLAAVGASAYGGRKALKGVRAGQKAKAVSKVGKASGKVQGPMPPVKNPLGVTAESRIQRNIKSNLIAKSVEVKGYNRGGTYVAASRSKRKVLAPSASKRPVTVAAPQDLPTARNGGSGLRRNNAPNEDVYSSNKLTREQKRVRGNLTRGARLDIENSGLAILSGKEYNAARTKRRLETIRSNPTLNSLLESANKGRKQLSNQGYMASRRSPLQVIKDRVEQDTNKVVRTVTGGKKGFVFQPKSAAKSSNREVVKGNVNTTKAELKRRLDRQRRLGNYSSSTTLLTLGN